MNNQNDKDNIPTPPISKKRQIIIETDGDNIELIKIEAVGSIELVAILQNVIDFIKKSQFK